MWQKFIHALLLGLLLSLPVRAEPLLIAANSWPPFTDQRLLNNGLAVDLVSTALNRAGFASQYIEAPWARVINGIENSNYDIAITAWFDPAREAFGVFSAPYMSNRIRVLQRKGEQIHFEQLADLQPYSIAVGRGYTYSPAFDHDTRLQKKPVTDFIIAARMLAAGRVQLTLEDEWVAQYYFAHELQDVREQLEFLPKPLAETPVHILVRRSHPQCAVIIDSFNRAIASMREDGTYLAILKRHGIE